jgi:transcription antitermination factor NusA-like protein
LIRASLLHSKDINLNSIDPDIWTEDQVIQGVTTAVQDGTKGLMKLLRTKPEHVIYWMKIATKELYDTSVALIQAELDKETM